MTDWEPGVCILAIALAFGLAWGPGWALIPLIAWLIAMGAGA